MKIFIDISPGFYKTNLFNELSKEMDILVVYTTCYDKSSRNNDFLSGNRCYPYVQLEGNLIHQAYEIIKIMLTNHYEEVIVGGYNTFLCWVPILFSRQKRGLIIESTFRETKTKGIVALLKKFFFKIIDRAYVCGTPHEKLARMFGFKGESICIGSVGLFNVNEQPPYSPRKDVKEFLFVGRLIPEKNLEWLIDRFAAHAELNLTIIGFGELENVLKNKTSATPNVKLIGAINNTDLPQYYRNADVFILPSKSETWGLVVEEALNNGTPVMCSNMVGSADDLVIKQNTGVVFELNNVDDFEKKLTLMCDVEKYNSIRENISKMDFYNYEKQVVESFIK